MKKYWELAELENEVFLSRPFWIFWVSHFEFFFCFISVKNAARSYEVSFISALWMVFPESWKRSCPNFYAHDCNSYAIAQIEMAHWATYIKLLWLELIYFREEDVRFESRRITIQFVQKFTTGLPLELLLPKINVITSSSTSSKIRDLTLTL